mgnify:CR=1 FL=1
MRPFARFVVAITLLPIALLATAAEAPAAVSSKRFLEDCLQPANPVLRAECGGYILGVADAINSNIVKGQRVCLPENGDQDDVRAEVMRWVRENAHLVQRMQRFGAVYAALIKTYPCRKR